MMHSRSTLLGLAAILAVSIAGPAFAQSERMFEGAYFQATVVNLTRVQSNGSVVVTIKVRGKNIGPNVRFGFFRPTQEVDNCATLIDTNGTDYSTRNCFPFVPTASGWVGQYSWSGSGAFMVRNEADTFLTLRFIPIDRVPSSSSPRFNLTIPVSTIACLWGYNGGLLGIKPECNDVVVTEESIAFFNLNAG